MDLNDLRSIFTVIMFVTFIGIWIWAWSGRRRKEFDEAANLPFAEKDAQQHKMSVKEVNYE